MNLFYILLAFVALAVLYIVAIYNSLVSLKVKIKEAWSGIEVQLKRRYDLIPNLVETVKGYAKHEKSVFENVTKARSALMSAGSPKEAAAADNMLTGALKSLFAVAENYPQLQASANFQELQRQLEDTEDKVAYARQFYNSMVMEFNTKIVVFPAMILANMMGFKAAEFFDAEEEAKKSVKVKFE